MLEERCNDPQYIPAVDNSEKVRSMSVKDLTQRKILKGLHWLRGMKECLEKCDQKQRGVRGLCTNVDVHLFINFAVP